MESKAGQLVSAVMPVAPEQVFTADIADPEKAAQAKAEQLVQQKGKYGAPKGKPFIAAATDTTEQTAQGWTEIALVDEEGKPVAGQKYEITLPHGKVAKGFTDGKGKAKIQGFVSGACHLTLPELHGDAW
jgi:hypothetical protein